MDSKQIEFLVKLRDAFQMVAEATDEYLGSSAPKETKDHLPESTFSVLKFEAQQGSKLGVFETALKPNNSDPPEKWSVAYNVLKKAEATIKNRYHGKGYDFSYWLYAEDRIYRQKLAKGEKPSATST